MVKPTLKTAFQPCVNSLQVKIKPVYLCLSYPSPLCHLFMLCSLYVGRRLSLCVCVCVRPLYSLLCQQAICCLLSAGRLGRTASMRLSLFMFHRRLMRPANRFNCTFSVTHRQTPEHYAYLHLQQHPYIRAQTRSTQRTHK